MRFGIDIGTTSVAGVAVDAAGHVAAPETRTHDATRKGLPPGVDEQDPARLLAATDEVIAALTAWCGKPERIGWTGQMHGVVAVDRDLKPLTDFVTWRDARRYGGPVMAGWSKQGLKPWKCLTAPGYAIAHRTGKAVIDETFLESWHLERAGHVPAEWLPELAPDAMLGDNQAGVFAAQHILPGCAVVNIGTSGQLSVVLEKESFLSAAAGVEMRPYPNGKRLLCRASLVGGQALAALRKRRGLSWDELNARAETDGEIRACLDGIVDDLAVGIDLAHVTGLVGVGNALMRNHALRAAVERRFGLKCTVPDIAEMAAYGVAVRA